jgi:hypothetical protein
MKRLQKKTIIGLVYLVAFTAFGGAFLLSTGLGGDPASCFDRVQNQDEEGIDCGGVCPACRNGSTSEIQDLTVRWAQIVSVKQGVYDAVALVENPNELYGGEEVMYRFSFLNAEGVILETVEGRSYIYPLEKRHIIAQAVSLREKPVQVLLDIQSVIWRRFTEQFSLEWIETVDKRFQSQPSTDPNIYARMSGIVVNNSPFNVRSIEIEMIVFTSDGKPIAVHRTDVQTMLRDERRFFEVIWPAPFSGIASNFVIFAHTNFFLNDNFIQEYALPEKFQEYY